MAQLIDGKAVAAADAPAFHLFHLCPELLDAVLRSESVRARLKEQIRELPISPGLAVIIVGERKDSQTYVRLKKKAAAEVGIKSFECELPASASQDQVIGKICKFNSDNDVHGILVQLPLPEEMNESFVLDHIRPEKDVDGLHPFNTGKLFSKGRAGLVPCTPAGCIELLDHYNVPIEVSISFYVAHSMTPTQYPMQGARAVVIGRSNIVGLPVAQLLQMRNATVTITHSRTKGTCGDVPHWFLTVHYAAAAAVCIIPFLFVTLRGFLTAHLIGNSVSDLGKVVQEADIVVAAIGKAQFVQASWIKPGAVVIDVGINPVDAPSLKSGYRLVGDCDFEGIKNVASLITPVPGGCGPMTIAMLLSNTVHAYHAIKEGASAPPQR
eukprot:gene3093-3638_t